jgi:TPR repeat protein
LKWWKSVAAQANPRLQCALGEFYRLGQGVRQSDFLALKWYRKAADAGDLAGIQATAWLLATSPISELRDGQAAIELSRKAAALTKRKDPRVLDTMAAAYAEAAQFAKAISIEKEAIALAQEDDQKQEYESRLKLYQARSPYRVLESPLRQPQLE